MDIAIVTGAGSGLGLAITRKLIELGLKVYGLGGQYDDARFDHEYFVPMPCNMGSLADVRARISEIIEREGDNIYVLVNNAKLYHHKSLAETSDEEMELAMKVNLLCPIALTRMALPSLTRLGGFVINIVANTAENSRGGAIGAATAGGLRWLGEALFDQLREDGVKVSNVFPQTNRWRPDGSVPAAQRPQSAIDLEAVAEAVGSIILNRYNNVITDVVIRPQRLAEKPVPPPFNVPYPKPQPLPKTTPREKEAHVTLAETRAEIHRHEHDLLRKLREREEAGLDDEDIDFPETDVDERDIDGAFHREGTEEPSDEADAENEAEGEARQGTDSSAARPEGSSRRRRGRRGGRNRHGGDKARQQNDAEGRRPAPTASDEDGKPSDTKPEASEAAKTEPAPKPAVEAKPAETPESRQQQPARKETKAERDERFERETRPQHKDDDRSGHLDSGPQQASRGQEPPPVDEDNPPAEKKPEDTSRSTDAGMARRRNRRNRRPSVNNPQPNYPVLGKTLPGEKPTAKPVPQPVPQKREIQPAAGGVKPVVEKAAPAAVQSLPEKKPAPAASQEAVKPAPEKQPSAASAETAKPAPAKAEVPAASPTTEKVAEKPTDGETAEPVAKKTRKTPVKRTRKTVAKTEKTEAVPSEGVAAEEKPAEAAVRKAPAKRTRKTPVKPRSKTTAAGKKAVAAKADTEKPVEAVAKPAAPAEKAEPAE